MFIFGVVLLTLVFMFGAVVGKTMSEARFRKLFKVYDENNLILIRAYQDMLNGAVNRIKSLETRLELGYDPEDDNG